MPEHPQAEVAHHLIDSIALLYDPGASPVLGAFGAQIGPLDRSDPCGSRLTLL
jgi:hypothetical protein